MMRRAGFLALLSLACLSLAASEAERRSLEAWQAALTATDRRQRIEYLTESLAERYSHAAEFLLGRTVWDDPAEAYLAADLLLTRLEETNATPELKTAEWLTVGLRRRFPMWKIGFDRWRQLEEAALAPLRQKDADTLAPAERNIAAELARQLAFDERALLLFEDALRTYDEARSLDPEPEADAEPDAFRALTAFAATVWDPENAALQKCLHAELEALAAQEPADDDPPEAWFKFGNWYLQFRDEAAACRVMRKLETLHPHWPGTIVFRLRLLEWQGDYAALAEQAALLEREKIELPAAYLLRFRAALCAERWEEAVKMAKKLREAPDAPSPMLADALMRAGRWREADAEIRRSPSPVREKLLLIKAMHRKDFKKALESLQQAEAKAQGEHLKDLRLALVGLAEGAGNRDLLEECWAKLEKSGDLADPEAANAVGYTAATMSYKLPEARKLIGSALAADPFSAAYQDSMAWVLFKEGDLAGARTWIERSLACSDRENDTELECHAGDICAAQGDREAAAAHYRRALAIRPRQPELNEAAIRAKLAKLEQPLP